MKGSLGLLSLLLLVLYPVKWACADESRQALALPPAAPVYVDRVALSPTSPEPIALESAFVLAAGAAEALTDAPTSVEEMDDSAAAPLGRLFLRITLIQTEHGVGAILDDSFFVRLSARSGTKADREFFRIRALAWDAWRRRRWVKLVADYSGCTDLGSGVLVEAWAEWSAYARRYPGHYIAAVTEVREEVQRALLEDECVCGSREDLPRELRWFVQRLPRDELVSSVKLRLEAVERGSAKTRYLCLPS